MVIVYNFFLGLFMYLFRHPFYLSISSKALLSVIPRSVTSKFPVVLHTDCTFKCNDNEFPILILGMTDACQQFHPLSISITSHTRNVSGSAGKFQ
jgi:hypothetical protein